MDEIPIIVLAVFGMFIYIPVHKWPSRTFRNIVFSWQCLLCTNVGLLILTLLNPSLSHIICMSTPPGVTIGFLYGFYFCKEKPWGFALGLIFITILSFTFWSVDSFYCEEATSFFEAKIGFYPQLHAWWHICSAFMLWMLYMACLKVRFIGDKKETKTLYDSYLNIIPFVYVV